MEAVNLEDYYVLLTGGKNNAGDFLIKHRAKKLLEELRPDRDLIDLNAWEPLNEEKLQVVNGAKALLLTGGPALRSHMYPGIYKLTDDLNDIQVPIITFGIGWKSGKGDWEDIYTYDFSSESKKLLDRIHSSGYNSSVRDYHSMHALQKEGIENVSMTGCPALYDIDSIGEKINQDKVNKILFSLGVSFTKSSAMKRTVKKIILNLRERFDEKDLTVMFHHSIKDDYLNTPDANHSLYYENKKFANWLEKKGIAFKDISGSAEKLIKEYSKADFHIGYRVHAHIFMSSISKPSILIAEDGRGKALRSLLGGVILDGYSKRSESLFLKGLNKIGLPVDLFSVPSSLPDLIMKTVNYETKRGFPRLKTPREHIDHHYEVMKEYTQQLP